MLSEESFIRAVVTALGLDGQVNELGLETGLYDGLDLDSLQSMHLLIIIEELAEALYPPEVIPDLFTVGDAYRYYCSLTGSDVTWTAIVDQEGQVVTVSDPSER